jgi:hypothetical protein
MAEIRKILGQLDADDAASGVAYTVAAGSREAIVSSLVFCNRSTTATLCAFVASSGDAVSSSDQFIYHNLSLPANDTFVATIGITLSGGDKIGIACDSALASAVTVNVFGVEIA